jgi:hypothetical protein
MLIFRLTNNDLSIAEVTGYSSERILEVTTNAKMATQAVVP